MSPPASGMQSIHALMNRLIDYAGLFPPAQLDMDQTVRNYAAYVQSEDSWMLGRLIVPAARLDEFDQHARTLLPRTFDDGDPWQIGALTAAAGSPEFAADIARIEAFNLAHEEKNAGMAVIDVIEAKADTSAAIDDAIALLSDDLFAFFEIPIDRDPRGLVAALVDGGAGAKARTGGIKADLYPSASDLARFLTACAAANVPFKATAGMHHPLRHFSSAVNTREHGFLNVFIAGCLALTEELDLGGVTELLEEESPGAFGFRDDSVRWRDYELDAENIEDVREEFAVSFGSCSFDEPRDDLRKLKLL